MALTDMWDGTGVILGIIAVAMFLILFGLSIVGAGKLYMLTHCLSVLFAALVFVIYLWYTVFNLKDFKEYKGIYPGLSGFLTGMMFIVTGIAIFDYDRANLFKKREVLLYTLPIYGHCVFAAIRRTILFVKKKNTPKQDSNAIADYGWNFERVCKKCGYWCPSYITYPENHCPKCEEKLEKKYLRCQRK